MIVVSEIKIYRSIVDTRAESFDKNMAVAVDQGSLMVVKGMMEKPDRTL